MSAICEVQPRRTAKVAYPCIACGSPVGFEQAYCAGCLRAAADQERIDGQDLDADLEPAWLRHQIERVA